MGTDRRPIVKLVAAISLAILCAACDEGATRPASSSGAPGAYCGDQGFVGGEQRNDADELIAECRVGLTPNGGAYSISRYSDADGPADKETATSVEIIEYDHDGNILQTTHGAPGG